MPASTMDPATGASTWALGSHKWVRNIGVFTRNAIIVINHQKVVREERGMNDQNGRVKDKWELMEKSISKENKSGRDAVMV